MKRQLILIIYFLAYSLEAFTINTGVREVHIGGSEYTDACGSYAIVDGFKKDSSFLSVRESPSLKSKEVDKLFKNQTLWICEETEDGKWLGIVYRKSTDKNLDCEVGSSQEVREAYKGPCRSGWVSEKYIKIVAG